MCSIRTQPWFPLQYGNGNPLQGGVGGKLICIYNGKGIFVVSVHRWWTEAMQNTNVGNNLCMFNSVVKYIQLTVEGKMNGKFLFLDTLIYWVNGTISFLKLEATEQGWLLPLPLTGQHTTEVQNGDWFLTLEEESMQWRIFSGGLWLHCGFQLPEANARLNTKIKKKDRLHMRTWYGQIEERKG